MKTKAKLEEIRKNKIRCSECKVVVGFKPSMNLFQDIKTAQIEHVICRPCYQRCNDVREALSQNKKEMALANKMY